MLARTKYEYVDVNIVPCVVYSVYCLVCSIVYRFVT